MKGKENMSWNFSEKKGDSLIVSEVKPSDRVQQSNDITENCQTQVVEVELR